MYHVLSQEGEGDTLCRCKINEYQAPESLEESKHPCNDGEHQSQNSEVVQGIPKPWQKKKSRNSVTANMKRLVWKGNLEGLFGTTWQDMMKIKSVPQKDKTFHSLQ